MASTVAVAVKDYDRIRVVPLTGTIGAEVVGIDLREVDDETFAELHDAFLHYKVLVYRDQRITDEQHLEFARRWGPLEIHPYVQNHPVHPEIIVLDSTPEKFSAADTWHSDVTFEQCPPLGSLLRGVIIPPFGGDTLFANMQVAYERLPDHLRDQIDGLTAHHTGELFTRHYPERKSYEADHPVARTHPETGYKAIYVNRNFTKSINELEPDESECLLTELTDQAKVPEYQCRVRWLPDTIVQWDNRCTQHYASPDYNQRRKVQRATVTGDRPY